MVAVAGDAVVGAAAIERYGSDGLLRSVVVSPALRGTGTGRALVTAAEELAVDLGIRELYLLTETAGDWFPRLGYGVLPRAAAPDGIAGSWEFRFACVERGVLMHRSLSARSPTPPRPLTSGGAVGTLDAPQPGRRRRKGNARMTSGRNAELDALIARLPGLDRGELLALAAEHAAGDPAREEAWRTVREAVTASHMERDLDRVRSEVAAWATHLSALTVQQLGSGLSDQLLAEARREAAPAVLDAAVAFLLGTTLPDQDRAALLRPWESVFAG